MDIGYLWRSEEELVVLSLLPSSQTTSYYKSIVPERCNCIQCYRPYGSACKLFVLEPQRRFVSPFSSRNVLVGKRTITRRLAMFPALPVSWLHWTPGNRLTITPSRQLTTLMKSWNDTVESSAVLEQRLLILQAGTVTVILC